MAVRVEQSRIVVRDLVIVPGDDERERGVSGLQIRIRLVLSVAVAIVLERDGLRPSVQSHAAWCAGGLVNVVAEMEYNLEILGRHVSIRRVVSHFELLTRGEGEPQP